MNWTGGRLKRHQRPRGRGKTNTARQREHFARIRQNREVNIARSESCGRIPFRPTFLDHRDEDDDGDAVRRRPPVRQFDTIKNRHRSSSLSGGDVRKVEGEGRDGYDKTNEISRTNPTHSEHESKSSSPLFLLKDEASLEMRKRRLLQQNNWVGLAPTGRPLQLHFSSHHDTERIGNRRKISGSIQARRTRVNEQRVEGFRTGRVDDVGERNFFMSGVKVGVSENISVRIGEDAVRGHYFARGERDSPTSTRMIVRRRESSETMLFDVENWEDARHVEKEVENSEEAVRRKRKRSSQNQAFPSSEPELQAETALSSEDNASLGFERSEDIRMYPAGTEGHSPDEYPQDLNRLLKDLNASHADDAHTYEKRTDRRPSPFREAGTSHFRLIFESSSPPEQAVPSARSKALSQLTMENSMHSRLKPTEQRHIAPVPLDETRVNRKRSWDGILNEDEQEKQMDEEERKWKKFLSISTSHTGTSASLIQPDTSRDLRDRLCERASMLARAGSKTHARREMRDQLQNSSIQTVQSFSKASRSIQTHKSLFPIQQNERSKDNDVEDELWRKFVLGEDYDGSQPNGFSEEVAGTPPGVVTSSLFVGASTSSFEAIDEGHGRRARQRDRSNSPSVVASLDEAEAEALSDQNRGEPGVRIEPTAWDAHERCRPVPLASARRGTSLLAHASSTSDIFVTFGICSKGHSQAAVDGSHVDEI